MNIYVVIITYNGMRWIAKCLESIPEKYKIIVVDNHSTDHTVNFIKKKFPEILLFEETKNLGFGQANNKGISYALQQGADYVFLLNQDAYLGEDTVEKMIRVHQENHEYGILSPIHTNRDKTKLDKGFANYMRFEKNPFFYSDYVIGNKLKKIYQVSFVNAAGWLIPKKVFKKVGGFDPIFFHYGEDNNFCNRVKYHGFKIGVVTNTFMVHDREARKIDLDLSKSALLAREEYLLKVALADIRKSKDLKKNIQRTKHRYKMNSCKALIKFNVRSLDLEMTKFKLLKDILPEIKYSIQKNKEMGEHYLK